MESKTGVQPSAQLEELASRREALRQRLALPRWWHAVFALAIVSPMVLRVFGDDVWFIAPAGGTVVLLVLLWYARHGRGVRPGAPRERTSAWQSVAAFAGGAALAAAMIAVAELSGREWLMIPFALAFAAAIAVGAARGQRVQLRDEEP